MTVKIRLARGGVKKHPHYRLVIADARAPRDGNFIEKVGTYDPFVQEEQKRVVIKTERIKHWLGQGASPTERVAKFLTQAGIDLPPRISKKIAIKAKAQTTKLSKKELKAIAEKK